MFTGIIERRGRVVAAADSMGFRRLRIDTGFGDAKMGQSVAVNGVCLTIAELDGGVLDFDVIAETLSKTNLGELAAGDHVNLERSLRVGDRLDGHFVQGHVDGVARLMEIRNDPGETRFFVEPPQALMKYIVVKGSVAIDGVSLTVAAAGEGHFEVALIPTTLDITTFGALGPGWRFNLETDITSRTIISWLERRNG